MTDLDSLVKDTSAYLTVKGEKASGRLSHAYLILTADKVNLKEYLKIFASLIACESAEPCGNCRACNLIKDGAHADVIFYPQGDSINSEEVNALIEESYLKPIELDKKIFVLCDAQDMNAQAQNKLLKTLEEPPQNVHILMGATSEFPLLSTIKSRVKKLEIPSFSKEKLFDALISDYPDSERLKTAIACSDGTVGSVTALYADERLKDITSLCIEIITDMQSSKDVLKYSAAVAASKCEVGEFLSVLELLFREMLVAKSGLDLLSNPNDYALIKDAKGFLEGSIIHALESIQEAQKRKKFNANPTMLIEWLLFQILEGKYKWQKL